MQQDVLKTTDLKQFRQMWSSADNTVKDIAITFGMTTLAAHRLAERMRQRGVPMARRRH